MDIKALMTAQGMDGWVEEQSAYWNNDAVQVRQFAQIFQARIKNQTIDGDGPGAAGRRARRVAGRFNRAARHLEKAAAALQGANAFYVREVLELPERRSKDAERKALRRQKLGIAAAAQTAIQDSLAASTHALHHGTPIGTPQVNAVQPPVYTHPQHVSYAGQYQAGAVPDISQLFDQEAM